MLNNICLTPEQILSLDIILDGAPVPQLCEQHESALHTVNMDWSQIKQQITPRIANIDDIVLDSMVWHQR